MKKMSTETERCLSYAVTAIFALGCILLVSSPPNTEAAGSKCEVFNTFDTIYGICLNQIPSDFPCKNDEEINGNIDKITSKNFLKLYSMHSSAKKDEIKVLTHGVRYQLRCLDLYIKEGYDTRLLIQVLYTQVLAVFFLDIIENATRQTVEAWFTDESEAWYKDESAGVTHPYDIQVSELQIVYNYLHIYTMTSMQKKTLDTLLKPKLQNPTQQNEKNESEEILEMYKEIQKLQNTKESLNFNWSLDSLNEYFEKYLPGCKDASVERRSAGFKKDMVGKIMKSGSELYELAIDYKKGGVSKILQKLIEITDPNSASAAASSSTRTNADE